MSASDPTERQLVARLAAHESWARTTNRTARTSAARDAFLATFDDQVDPDRVLTPDERARRAANARKAHFIRLALRSAAARRSAAAHRQAMAELGEATALLRSVADAADPACATAPSPPAEGTHSDLGTMSVSDSAGQRDD